jgi:2Fe-2S ferredoxin
MPKINYIIDKKNTRTIEVANGLTVMEGAIQNDIPGIDADCGGGMACATCHGLINLQKRKMEKKICWIWLLNLKKIAD